MPTEVIKFKPGINTEYTPTLNEGGWSQSDKIRFRMGAPEKLGGWARINTTPLIGTGRGMHVWADLASNNYAAVGTEQRLMLLLAGAFTDITPLEQTDNLTPAFATTAGSKVVTVTDVGATVKATDWINVNVPVAIGGIIIQGFYQIQTVPSAGTYTILLASNAVSTASGGTVPRFTAVISTATINVNLTNHGQTLLSNFIVQVATTVGGILLAAGAAYSVTSVTNVNNFVITPGPSAGSSQTVFENSGNAQIQYLVPTGNASSFSGQGYGYGPYGAGVYGIGSSANVTSPIRQWFLDHWGQDLIGNYTGSPIYVWLPPASNGNIAIPIDTTNFPSAASPPTMVNASFVALPQQMLFALGVDPASGGAQDPNLLRWCDVADFTDWVASATNQAGSFRIPSGSKIMGGLIAQQFGYIWTDVDMWMMSYLGFPLVWGFNKIAAGADLMSGHAAGLYASKVYWATRNQFMVFDGSQAQVIPCPVWDFFFKNLDRQQIEKVNCAVNSLFGEVTWYFPSTAGNGEIDSYVTYAVTESEQQGLPIWQYGMLDRTCWFDTSVLGSPMGCDTTGNLQQHEISPNADGQRLRASIQSGFVSVAEGEYFTHIERVIGDFLLQTNVPGASARVFYSIIVQDYPNDSTTTYGPYQWTTTGPGYSIINARGRVVAIEIQWVDFGVSGRVGAIRYKGSPDGQR